jgi:hypothetical protein
MPPEIAMFGGQQRVRDAIVASPPDWFVLTSGEAESFGFKSFAIDYAADIWRWIEPRYEVVATAGDAQFAMRLYRRSFSPPGQGGAGGGSKRGQLDARSVEQTCSSSTTASTLTQPLPSRERS